MEGLYVECNAKKVGLSNFNIIEKNVFSFYSKNLNFLPPKPNFLSGI